MRVVMVLLGTAAVVLGFGVPAMLSLRKDERRDRRAMRAAPGDDEARRMALLMARLLDQALTDPMYRQSREWEDQAKVLVDGYYGKGLKA